MANNELHSVIDELSEYQIGQIRKTAERYLAMNSELSDTTAEQAGLLRRASPEEKGRSIRGMLLSKYARKQPGKKESPERPQHFHFSICRNHRQLFFTVLPGILPIAPRSRNISGQYSILQKSNSLGIIKLQKRSESNDHVRPYFNRKRGSHYETPDYLESSDLNEFQKGLSPMTM